MLIAGDIGGTTTRLGRGSKPSHMRSWVGAAKADDATLIFSGGCEHGSECWRGGKAVAK